MRGFFNMLAMTLLVMLVGILVMAAMFSPFALPLLFLFGVFLAVFFAVRLGSKRD